MKTNRVGAELYTLCFLEHILDMEFSFRNEKIPRLHTFVFQNHNIYNQRKKGMCQVDTVLEPQHNHFLFCPKCDASGWFSYNTVC